MTLETNIVGHLHNNSHGVEDEKVAEITRNWQRGRFYCRGWGSISGGNRKERFVQRSKSEGIERFRDI